MIEKRGNAMRVACRNWQSLVMGFIFTVALFVPLKVSSQSLQLPSVIEHKNYVPISVGDINIFIPINPKWSQERGSVDKGVVCKEDDLNQKMVEFYCKFLTRSFWENAGKPNYRKHFWDLPGWKPVYFKNIVTSSSGNSVDRGHPELEGLLDYMYLNTSIDGIPHKYVAIAPWSPILDEMNPNLRILGDLVLLNEQATDTFGNPSTVKRMFIMSFGQNPNNADIMDPTRNYNSEIDTGTSWASFDYQSMAIYLDAVERYKQSFVDVKSVLEFYGHGGNADSTIKQRSKATKWRDGEATLVWPGGKIDNLTIEAAATYAAYYGYVYVNGSLNSYDEAVRGAQRYSEELSSSANQVIPVVHFYNAVDLPDYDNNIGDRPLLGLLQEFNILAFDNLSHFSDRDRISFLCHSHGTLECQVSTWYENRADVTHVAPAHLNDNQSELIPFNTQTPGHSSVWSATLDASQSSVSFACGDLDPVSLIGNGCWKSLDVANSAYISSLEIELWGIDSAVPTSVGLNPYAIPWEVAHSNTVGSLSNSESCNQATSCWKYDFPVGHPVSGFMDNGLINIQPQYWQQYDVSRPFDPFQ